MGNRVIDRALQTHGNGYLRELPLERWYREAKAVENIADGTDEIQKMIISRNLLKGHVRTTSVNV